MIIIINLILKNLMREILIMKNCQLQTVLKYKFPYSQNFNKEELCRNKKINGNISNISEGVLKLLIKQVLKIYVFNSLRKSASSI